MRLPKRGFLIDPATGQAVWSWQHNNPLRDFDALPPTVTTLDGDIVSVARPDMLIFDLDADVDPTTMRDVQRDIARIRLRRDTGGAWVIKVQIGEDANGDPVEIDHAAEVLRKIKRAQAQQKPPLH